MSLTRSMELRRCAAVLVCLLSAMALTGCGSGLPDMSSLSKAASRDKDYVTVGNPPVRLAVRDRGKGRPVVLIHGMGTSSYTWRDIAPALAKTHRVITIDLKGFGASEKPLKGPYTVRAQADLVKAVLEKKNLRGATLVGHSYGGGISLLIALDQAKAAANRVDRLVLMDSIAYPQETPLFFDLIQLPVIGDLSVSVIPPEVQIEQALRLAYEDESAVTETAIARYSAPLHTAGGKHAVIETVRNIVPRDVEALARRYPSITLPTMIIWCDKDRVVPIELGQRLADNMPRAALHVVRGCGHAPQEERPAETLKVISAHLQGRYDSQLAARDE